MPPGCRHRTPGARSPSRRGAPQTRRCPRAHPQPCPRSAPAPYSAKVPSTAPFAVSAGLNERVAWETSVQQRLAKLREAEVQQLRAGLGQHHVPGLQVAVGDAARMRRVERAGDLLCRTPEHVEWQWTADQSIGERFAGDQLEDQEVDRGSAATGAPRVPRAVAANIEERADVRMTERRHGAGLDVEPLPRFRVHGQIGGHRLDGHRSIQTDVAGPIHFAHAAGAQRFENFGRAEVSPRGQHHKERADYSVHTPSKFPEGENRRQGIDAGTSSVIGRRKRRSQKSQFAS